MKSQARQTKTTRATRNAKSADAKALAAPLKRGKKAEVQVLPKAVTKSVVAKAWKSKAGKAGVWKSDAVRDAITSAFLAEGGNDVDPKVAARKATDAILSENHLDAGRWEGKNPGMLSMNLGNVLRAIQRNDGAVFVRGKKIAA